MSVIRMIGMIGWLGALMQAAASAEAAAADHAACCGPQQREAQQAYVRMLNEVPSAQRLREWHDLFCAEPHPAGSPGDQRMIITLQQAFTELGLEVETHEFHALLSRPIDAAVQIITGAKPIDLPTTEQPLAEDLDTQHEALDHGWNAYSASGDVTAGVIYANYGTKEDFEKLRELGVDVTGRIVLARYGNNFRGYKAKFAEQAGAVGLLIFTDPADSGYLRGLPYPEGGYANDTSIQRGSIKTLPYAGDALTPFEEATEDAVRLDADEVALPRIPVQPIGWRAAHEIMQRMDGDEVPSDDWQGGLPLRYRVTSSDAIQVRVMVEQERAIIPSANVLGVIKGTTHPDQLVIVGCHFDAWGFGAGDPHAGSIVLFEMARSFAEAMKQGRRPKRSIIFANWGAEEFGIIGSTEWVEANRQRLSEHGIAYINLDMAAMGPNFNCSAAPILKKLIIDAARDVPVARGGEGVTVFDQWRDATEGKFTIGNLGGGSDHIGFYCHVGVPSCGLGGGGSRGVSYHSNYDTIAWYRKVVGDDYEPALMLARIGNIITARLANCDLLPFDLVRYATDTREHLTKLEEMAAANQMELDTAALRERLDLFELAAETQQDRLAMRMAEGAVSAEEIERLNTMLLTVERRWLRDAGLTDRPWFRNLFAASDPDSGYAAWMLPELRLAIERNDATAATAAINSYVATFDSLAEALRSMEPDESESDSGS